MGATVDPGVSMNSATVTASTNTMKGVLSQCTGACSAPTTPIAMGGAAVTVTNKDASNNFWVWYQPSPDENDDTLASHDKFDFHISDDQDPQQVSEGQTVEISVNPVNDKPIAEMENSFSTREDEPVTITLAATDIDDDTETLSYFVVTPPDAAQGKLYDGPNTSCPLLAASDQVTDLQHRVTFMPNENLNGMTLAYFLYRVKDSVLYSSPFNVSFDVEPMNDAPTTNDIAATAIEDDQVVVPIPCDDVDADDRCMAVLLTLPEAGTLYQYDAAAGDNRGPIITIAGTVTDSDRRVVFVPLPDGNGEPYTEFSFRVVDAMQAKSGPHTCTLNVTAVNDAPIATLESPITVNEDESKRITLVGTDVDEPTDPRLAFQITELPDCVGLSEIPCSLKQSDGTPITTVPTVVTSNQGDVYFQAGLNQFGDNYTHFSYVASDREGANSDPIRITIHVDELNDPPSVNPIYPIIADEDVPHMFRIIGEDIDGPQETVTGLITSLPMRGSLHQYDDQQSGAMGAKIVMPDDETSVRLTDPLNRCWYVPPQDEWSMSKFDEFQFRTWDGEVPSTDVQTVIVYVAPVNDQIEITVPQQNLNVTPGEWIVIKNTTVTDVDAGTRTIQATITTTNGIFQLARDQGLTFTTRTDSEVDFVGSLPDVNAALVAINYKSNTAAGGENNDTLTLTANDQGNYGKGGPTTFEKKVTIVVSAQASDMGSEDSYSTPIILSSAGAGAAAIAGGFKWYHGRREHGDLVTDSADAPTSSTFSSNPLFGDMGDDAAMEMTNVAGGTSV